MNRTALSIALSLTILGCSSSGKSTQDSSDEQSLADALTRGVVFAHGLVQKGAIGKADADARKVKLAGTAGLDLKPQDESLMALDVDNPDQDDNAFDVTLMQFAGSSSHIEVPAKYALARADGGTAADAGGDTLHVALSFSVDADICASLCNKRFSSELEIAIALADGSISTHQTRTVTLDCRRDGNPKKCGKGASGNNDAGATGGDGGGSTHNADGGMVDVTRDGGGMPSRGDAGGTDSGQSNTDASTGSGNAPQIGPLSPLNTSADTALTLSIAGSGFIDGAVAYVDGVAVDTTFQSDSALEAAIAASSTHVAGSLAIYVENVADDITSRSNVLYLQVDPAPGAPVVYDYSPDNGVAGDTIQIIASNLVGQTLQIEDSAGNKLTPGTLGTISWPNAGSVDTVEIVLPRGIQTGPISVANSTGSFQSKIFTVGQNLTRTSGTTLDSSTQYNETNWARVSGGDNQLATSFFTAHGDCASMTTCTTKPWFQITFASNQTVARIAMRGNREYASGYDFLSGKFELLDASNSVLWTGTYDLPAPDRDLDITLPSAVSGARKVKFSSLEDESDEPGFSELEVFAK